MKAGNGAQRSDRTVRRVDPVAPLRYAPGFHLLLKVFRRKPNAELLNISVS